LQKRDGYSWCFVPQSETVVPAAWQPPEFPERQAIATGKRVYRVYQPKEPAESKQKPHDVKPAEVTNVPNPNHGNSGKSGDYGNADEGKPSDADTMDTLEDLIHDHLVCSSDQGAILALWILHTYCYQVSYHTPYLNISSAVEESGKS